MSVKIYGIKNCNTMKKAFDWLEENGVAYEFHDYKKEGADEAVLEKAFAQHGWKNVINRKGMTWRNLPDAVKEGMDEAGAKAIAIEKPSIIKRPLIIKQQKMLLGYDDNEYKKSLI